MRMSLGKAAQLQPVPEDGPVSDTLETHALRTGERKPASVREKPANLEEPDPPLAPGLSELWSLLSLR